MTQPNAVTAHAIEKYKEWRAAERRARRLFLEVIDSSRRVDAGEQLDLYVRTTERIDQEGG